MFNFSHVELGIILTCSIFVSMDAQADLSLGLNAAMPSSTNSSNGSLTDNYFSFHLNSKPNPSLSWCLLHEKPYKNVHVNLIKQEQGKVLLLKELWRRKS